MGIRITTWNVNGIRNPFGYQPWREKRTFEGMFDILEADIIIFQETKIQRKDLRDDMVLVPGWDNYWSLPKHKKGKPPHFHGAAVPTRVRILGSRHIHSQCHLCSGQGRGGHHRHSDTAQQHDQFSRPPGRRSDWGIPKFRAALSSRA